MTDWELYWDIVGNMSSVLRIAANGALLVRFVRPFPAQGRHTAVIGIVYTAVILVCKFVPWELGGMTVSVIGAGAAFLAMYAIDRHRLRQKVFLAVLYSMVKMIAWGIVLLPWSALYDRLLLRPEMMNRPYLSFALFILMELLLILLDCLAIDLLIRVIHRVYRCKGADMTARELLMMLAPSVAAVAGYILIDFFYNAYVEASGRVETIHSRYDGIRAGYLGICFASVLVVIILYQQLREQQEKEKENAVLSRQTEDIMRHIRELDRLYLDIRSLKHDMGNHVMVLEKLYGQSGEAKAYLEKLRNRVDETFEEIRSGNTVTDVILSEKSKEAAEKGIAFRQAFTYPQDTGPDVFDVSIILSNALNNAIEAAQTCEAAYVSVASWRKGNAYMIEVRNSMNGMRCIDEESGLPLTDKTGSGHGFGLVNIRKVARRYHGDIRITQSEGEFALCVMLMMK
ncbi:MAG: GHKL domain-containing protein [Roseburia sp.]|nr:GHKL domain-containing protein [Roseburia sp.]